MDNTDIFTDIVKKHDKELGGLITDLITENNKLTKERDTLLQDNKRLRNGIKAMYENSKHVSNILLSKDSSQSTINQDKENR